MYIFVNTLKKKDFNMIRERYSIEVGEGIVEIHGKLTIEEAFDFLNFFEKKGFDEVGVGDENSCLRLFNNKVIYGDKVEEPVIPERDFWEGCYHEKELENLKLRDKIKQLESLIKEFMHPDPERLMKFVDKINSNEMKEEELPY
jgi:hypothetical protein